MTGFNSVHRQCEPEVMDQPGLDRGLHRQALAALRRVNWLSGTAGSLWGPIVQLAKERSGRPLQLLDVACGGGDVALRLARRAAASKLNLSVTGCDLSETAIDFARDQAQQSGLGDVSFFVHDAVRDPLPEQYDIVTCTLFLHHLDEESAVSFLRHLAAASRCLVMLSDLRRTRMGYCLAQLVGRVLTLSPVVRVDGPLSAAAAFRIDEVRSLAERAGLTGASIRPIWPQRFLLSWRNP